MRKVWARDDGRLGAVENAELAPLFDELLGRARDDPAFARTLAGRAERLRGRMRPGRTIMIDYVSHILKGGDGSVTVVGDEVRAESVSRDLEIFLHVLRVGGKLGGDAPDPTAPFTAVGLTDAGHVFAVKARVLYSIAPDGRLDGLIPLAQGATARRLAVAAAAPRGVVLVERPSGPEGGGTRQAVVVFGETAAVAEHAFPAGVACSGFGIDPAGERAPGRPGPTGPS